MDAAQVVKNEGGDDNRGQQQQRGGWRGRGRGGDRGRGAGRGRGGGRWNSRFDNNQSNKEDEHNGDELYGEGYSSGGGNTSRGGGGNSNRGGGGNINRDRPERSFKHHDEPAEKKEPKKFTGRCRLFVGNLPNGIEDEEFKELFTKFGEIAEIFVNKQKAFGFIRLDTRIHAMQAKDELDGTEFKNRTLRVRFATHGAALKIKHLPSSVSNELLEEAFSSFGEIERAVVIVDEKGKSTNEGIVEFARRPGATKALQACTEGVLLLTSSPRPVTVEPLIQLDEEDGLPERLLPKNNSYMKDRSQSWRFPPPGTFEFDFGQRWKQLYEMEAKEKERLKKEMDDAIEKLEMEMTNAQHEHHANKLREELRRIEELKQQDERRLMDMLARRHEQREEEQRRMMQHQQHGGYGGGGGGQSGFMDRSRQQDFMMEQMRRQERHQQGAGDQVKPEVQEQDNGSREGQSPQEGAPQRQSRFDQPPENFQGGMLGVGRDLMRERMLERRDNRPREDSFHDNKRGRRY